MTWKRITLRRRLSKVANLLISRYGYSNFYTEGQVRTVSEMYGKQRDLEYCAQLFIDPTTAPAAEQDSIRDRRRSLYRYLDREVSEYEIEKNDYRRTLNLPRFAKIPGEHTAIGMNSDAFWGSGGAP